MADGSDKPFDSQSTTQSRYSIVNYSTRPLSDKVHRFEFRRAHLSKRDDHLPSLNLCSIYLHLKLTNKPSYFLFVYERAPN